jgi:hypothetical protein
MKFRKLTHILTVLAFSTLMHATQAYADIIKMDALLIDTYSYNTFQRFDDKLGTLIDVTYFYEGILTARGFNDCCAVVAADWEGGIDIQVITYFGTVSSDTNIINVRSFDIDDGGFLSLFDIAVSGTLFSSYPAIGDVVVSSNTPMIAPLSPLDGKFNCGGSIYTLLRKCLSTESPLSMRVVYTYDTDAITQVSGPTTLAIFALGLMGIMSRRFKKQS